MLQVSVHEGSSAYRIPTNGAMIPAVKWGCVVYQRYQWKSGDARYGAIVNRVTPVTSEHTFRRHDGMSHHMSPVQIHEFDQTNL